MRFCPAPMALATLAMIALAPGCVRQRGAFDARAEAEDDPNPPPVRRTDLPSAVFTLDGEPFCFDGTNNYYVTYKSRKMVDDVIDTAKAMGLKTIRVWSYIDRGSLDGTVPSVDGAGEKDGVYFQYWDAATRRPGYNDGPSGLEHLDYVLDAAKNAGLKVILVLTNNWNEFGGMKQYLFWYGLHDHAQFFTDPRVAEAYKGWALHLALRQNTRNGTVYRDDPTIFAWELANEPRCIGSEDLPVGGACKPAMITRWAGQMSRYIKSVDPNHIVSVGDEGFFAGGSSREYDGTDGVDHAALLAVPDIDFGTFHLYPDGGGHRMHWTEAWIEDHIHAARKAGKPTVLEEYGIRADRDINGVPIDEARRMRAYQRWNEVVERRGGDASLFWMLTGKDDEPSARRGVYPDYDHFALYRLDRTAAVLQRFAFAMPSGAEACALYEKFAPKGSIRKSPFVSVAPPPALPAPAAESRPPRAEVRGLTMGRRQAGRTPPPHPSPRYTANVAGARTQSIVR